MNHRSPFVRRHRWPSLVLFMLLLVGSSVATSALAGQSNRPSMSTAAQTSQTTETQVFLPLIFYPNEADEPLDEYQLLAFSDALPLPPVSELEPELVALQVAYCSTIGLPPPATLTFSQARQNAQTYLEQLVGAATFAQLQAELANRSPGEIATFVMAAMAAGETDGALAALLIAVDRFPTDPLPLVNAAGLLSSSGLPNEALAFLDAAAATGNPYGSPMGVDGEQMALNNRAHAHLMLGQWAEAEAILQGVVVAEPQLAEARTNLSRALLCQNQHAGAALWYRLGERRTRWDELIEEPEIQEQMIPIEQLYDLSAGKIYHAPIIPKPDKPEQAGAFRSIYEAMHAEEFGRMMARQAEYPGLADMYNNRQLPYLEQSRLDSIYFAWGFVIYQPDMVAMQQSIDELSYELFLIEDDHTHELNELYGSGLVGEPLYQACRSLLTTQFAQRMTKYYQLEAATLDYMVALYAGTTGVMANAHDPVLHDLLMNVTEGTMDSWYYGLVYGMSGWNTLVDIRWSACMGGNEARDDTGDSLALPAPDQCPDFVRGIKVGASFSDFVTVSITCEIIDVEISGSQGISPFVQYTHDLRNNEVTAFFGAKAKVNIGPFLELNAKEGLYVRANQNGLKDVGMKVASGGAIYAGNTGISGQIDGPEMEAGVAAAVAYWFGPN
jgi:hypothetical protein